MVWPALAAEVTPERLINADREPQNWLMNHCTYDDFWRFDCGRQFPYLDAGLDHVAEGQSHPPLFPFRGPVAAGHPAADDAVHLHCCAYRVVADVAPHDLRRAAQPARLGSAIASHISTISP